MSVILDASAVLAVILAEEGADVVLRHMSGAHLATVNLSETMAKLMEYGLSVENAQQQIGRLELNVHDFNSEQAERTAILRGSTKQFGLSLGDRACLALSQSMDLPVLTSDRRMAEANVVIGLDIRLIR
ncbi:MAG: type II toxin-antitoxin system VapC family toxin [Sphingorhabdus sp.]